MAKKTRILLATLAELACCCFFYFLLFSSKININLLLSPMPSSSLKNAPLIPQPTLPHLDLFLGALCAAGSVVLALLIFAPLSGAHINPLFTLGMMMLRKISLIQGSLYLMVQLAGSILAASFAKLCFTNYFVHMKFDTIYADGPVGLLIVEKGITSSSIDIIVMETVLSFIFILAIYIICHESLSKLGPRKVTFGSLLDPMREKIDVLYDEESPALKQADGILSPGLLNGGQIRHITSSSLNSALESHLAGPKLMQSAVAVAILVMILIFVGSSPSGAVFNPAILLGPAVLQGQFSGIWAYLLGQSAGLLSGTLIYAFAYIPARLSLISPPQ